MTFRERVQYIRRSYPLPGMFEGLRRVSDDKWSGPCLMHGGDNILGFAVTRRDGEWRWRCFTGDCGGGDAIDIVTRRERCSLREAMDILDGGGSIAAGARAHVEADAKPPSAFLVCDACRNEVAGVKPRTNKHGTTSVDFEVLQVADRLGWELGADAEFAVGPSCLARAGL